MTCGLLRFLNLLNYIRWTSILGETSPNNSVICQVLLVYTTFTLPEIESTDPIEKSHRSYNDVFNNQSRDLSYMIKIADTTATSTESHLMKYISPIIQNRENVERSMLRIQTNPWRHSCHFDTYDQTVIMLDGVKQWLLFRIVFDDTEKKRILSKV